MYYFYTLENRYLFYLSPRWSIWYFLDKKKNLNEFESAVVYENNNIIFRLFEFGVGRRSI